MPDASLAAITGFHFIEHLPFTEVIRLLDEALRLLRPGGVIILETPNPGNLLMASDRFYVDPTRRRPLPAELMTFAAETRGFTRVETKFVNVPPGGSPNSGESPLMLVLRERIYAALEYAVIGWKA
jgi:SAM-dependent methyltransferase